jgi:hypothetical protein
MIRLPAPDLYTLVDAKVDLAQRVQEACPEVARPSDSAYLRSLLSNLLA